MIDKVFEATIKSGTPFDRAALSSLASNPEMGANAPLVYIYSLATSEPSIPYPKGAGRTLYIGETQRETGSWRRFPAHFSGSLTNGLSTLINHTLSVYYHAGKALYLRVFRVTDGRATTDAERIMLRAHLHSFGAYPLGQGGTGKSNSPCEVSRLYMEHEDLHSHCARLYGCAL